MINKKLWSFIFDPIFVIAFVYLIAAVAYFGYFLHQDMEIVNRWVNIYGIRVIRPPQLGVVLIGLLVSMRVTNFFWKYDKPFGRDTELKVPKLMISRFLIASLICIFGTATFLSSSSIGLAALPAVAFGDISRYVIANDLRSSSFVGARLLQGGLVSIGLAAACIGVSSTRVQMRRVSTIVFILALLLLLTSNILVSQRLLTVWLLAGTLSIFFTTGKLRASHIFLGSFMMLLAWIIQEWAAHFASTGNLTTVREVVRYSFGKIMFYLVNNFHNFACTTQAEMLGSPVYGLRILDQLFLGRVFGESLFAELPPSVRACFGGGTPTFLGELIINFSYVAIPLAFVGALAIRRVYLRRLHSLFSLYLYALVYGAALLSIQAPMLITEFFVFNALLGVLIFKRIIIFKAKGVILPNKSGHLIMPRSAPPLHRD